MKFNKIIIIIIFFLLISNLSIALSKESIKINQKYYSYENTNLNNLDITFIVYSDKTSYKWLREQVQITMEIRNNDENNFAILKFPTTQLYDVIIDRNTAFNIYQWSDSKTFNEVITEIIIFPGETARWYLSWNQTGHFFKFMPFHPILPGKLTIKAILPLIDMEYQAECNIKIGLI